MVSTWAKVARSSTAQPHVVTYAMLWDCQAQSELSRKEVQAHLAVWGRCREGSSLVLTDPHSLYSLVGQVVEIWKTCLLFCIGNGPLSSDTKNNGYKSGYGNSFELLT